MKSRFWILFWSMTALSFSACGTINSDSQNSKLARVPSTEPDSRCSSGDVNFFIANGIPVLFLVTNYASDESYWTAVQNVQTWYTNLGGTLFAIDNAKNYGDQVFSNERFGQYCVLFMSNS